jgi:hypothetical protein
MKVFNDFKLLFVAITTAAIFIGSAKCIKSGPNQLLLNNYFFKVEIIKQSS